MKTLIVASSYLSGFDPQGVWRTDRTFRWACFNRNWGFDGLLIHNPVKGYEDHDLHLLRSLVNSWATCKVHIMHPMVRVRETEDALPNWMTCEVLKSYLDGYDKIIYIDTDAFVLSERMRQYMLALETGWTVFWCARDNFPENGIMVICKDHFEKFKNINFLSFNKKGSAERLMPYTLVNKDFIGDRYSEYGKDFAGVIPDNADYAVNVKYLPKHPWI